MHAHLRTHVQSTCRALVAVFFRFLLGENESFQQVLFSALSCRNVFFLYVCLFGFYLAKTKVSDKYCFQFCHVATFLFVSMYVCMYLCICVCVLFFLCLFAQ